jgi:hypothetical protein
MRPAGPYWQPVSFVRSTKEVLARCMREKGVGAETACFLLFGLPNTFDEWKALPLRSSSISDPVVEEAVNPE